MGAQSRALIRIFMPTCTLPYEVLLEFTNDTHDAATLQLMRGDHSPGGGAMILLQRRESVSLVLNAGSVYQYTLRQGEKARKISCVGCPHQPVVNF